MESASQATYRVGDLLIDLGRGQVLRDGVEIPLPPLSFHLLRALVEAAPNLVTQDELMRVVWSGLVVTPETISQRAKLLRHALGDDPREPRYLIGVRGRGYRLAAPVEILPPPQRLPLQDDLVAAVVTSAVPVLDSPSSVPTATEFGARPRAHSNRWLAAGALCTAAAVALLLRAQSGNEAEAVPTPSAAEATAARPVLAVLPFVKLGGPDDPLSLPDGLQSDILTELSRIQAIDVIAATSVEQFRGTTLDARDIGQRLGATHLLEGGVQRVGDRVRINAQLIEARSQGHVWAATYDRPLTPSNLFSVQAEIADAVAEALRVALSGEKRGSRRTMPTNNIDAWALEKAARIQLERRTTESIAHAERLFRQAIALDPQFARAYAGLADAIWLNADQLGLPWLPAASEAERLASIALRLDPEVAEAWTTRAKLAQERHDFETAEASYQRAFELNPNYARVHAWYSQFMYQLGRDQESRAATQRAAELDPMSAPLLVNLGLAVADPQDPTAALAIMDKALAIDPNGWLGATGKAMVYALAGRYDEALQWDLKALRLDPRAGYAMVGAAHRHLELDDLEGTRLWLRSATEAGREIPGAFSHDALMHFYSGEPGDAVASARRALAFDPRDPNAFRVLDADALRRGQIDAIIATVHGNFPDLAGPQTLRIRRATLLPATDLALAFRLKGDRLRSDALLDAVTTFLEATRNEGTVEYMIDETRVLAIRGDTDAALHALTDLVGSGWRGPYWRYYRDHDPAFDTLRSNPRFRRAFEPIERDIKTQRARAASSGNLGIGPAGALASRDKP